MSLARSAELVEFDQAIAATVLRMARSWTYAGSRPPDTVRDAVLRLGTVPLLNMVLGDYLTHIKASAPLYDVSEDDLWAHAAAAQLAVRAIGQWSRPVSRVGHDRLDIGVQAAAHELAERGSI